MISFVTEQFCQMIVAAGLAGKCALAHEAAIDSWQLDNNEVPYCLDFACKSLYSGCCVAELGDETPRLVEFEQAGKAWVGSFKGVPVRAWHKFSGVPWRKLKRIGNESVGVECVDPFIVLEEMEKCPEMRFLYEQRAALAACLFVDDMPADQLKRFIDYVRPC
mgnify:CR=1 FL=1